MILSQQRIGIRVNVSHHAFRRPCPRRMLSRCTLLDNAQRTLALGGFPKLIVGYGISIPVRDHQHIAHDSMLFVR